MLASIQRRGLHGLGAAYQGITDPLGRRVAIDANANMKLLDWTQGNAYGVGTPPVVKVFLMDGDTVDCSQWNVDPATGKPDPNCKQDSTELLTVDPTTRRIVMAGAGAAVSDIPEASLGPSLAWAQQNSLAWAQQQAKATKPGQSVPPAAQSGEVVATGSGASLKVDTSPATTLPAAGTGFDLSSLFTTQNLLIGGAVLVGLFVVMGMGRK
jgi:hypothetical protein